MILIADSGSTKTDWGVVTTQGINPFHMSQETIREILNQELMPHLHPDEIESVFFYGSGVRPELEAMMEALLSETFPQATTVEAHSDLLGAARALCGRDCGIAAILGTGANSCLYDGERIVDNTPAMGYILGDEGSGAVLGKLFVHHLYKGLLSKEIVSDFEEETGLSMATIIDRVYRQPLPNRFLASLSEYIHRHLDVATLRELVISNFEDFFRCNVEAYQRTDLPVHFVGSIAWYYQDELREAAARTGYSIGTVLRNPMEGLRKYHEIR